MTALSPLSAYQHALEHQGFVPDEAQLQAARQLEECYQALQAGRETRGVYLWGPVGRGKTWLMDRFHESLTVPSKRLHFHHFMGWVHKRLFQITGTADPLRALAREMAQKVRVLCFDEFFVNDIGDAILLGGLMRQMFEQGVVVVCTSNLPPQDLYADGFNRDRFVPAIKAIEEHMWVASLDGEQDHRLHPGQALQRYWVSEARQQQSPLEAVFCNLCDGRAASQEPVLLGHQQIPCVKRCSKVAWFSFHALCNNSLSALDFIGLCDRFPAILLSEVPNLSSPQRAGIIARGTEDSAERVEAGDRELPSLSVHDDSVRRFIALVDECYDRHIPLYLEAAVPLEQLYTQGYLAFAFERTRSRLQEMQLQRFGQGYETAATDESATQST
ncbi:MAG: cell division protein ZapE [Halopseudomonas sp.]|uniref:cell division protein ZapE n=1 Tax=Halopseudomonas sp. TaxID=2901191 RepID=UPI00300114A5